MAQSIFRQLTGLVIIASTSLFAVNLHATPGVTALQKYGVCSGIDPACYNDWADRTSGDEAPWKVLIYYHVGEGVRPHANREFGVRALSDALTARGYEVTSSEDPASMQSGFGLRSYDAIIFFNTGRDALDSLGQMSLRIYIEGGGGFVGIHNAFGTLFNWNWYEGLLGGAQLYDHGPFQSAEMIVHSEGDISTSHLPDDLVFEDEFYNLFPNPQDDGDVLMLLSVDESTRLQGTQGYYDHPGYGDDVHAVSWCHYYDGGRAWLTTLGHSEEIFENENFLGHVIGGIDSVMGKEPFCQE